LGDQIKKNEMGKACSTYGREERFIQGFGEESLREGDHLEYPDVDGRMILKSIFEILVVGGGGAWTGLIWLRIGTCGGLF
jgi:hypothetical protein